MNTIQNSHILYHCSRGGLPQQNEENLYLQAKEHLSGNIYEQLYILSFRHTDYKISKTHTPLNFPQMSKQIISKEIKIPIFLFLWLKINISCYTGFIHDQLLIAAYSTSPCISLTFFSHKVLFAT